MKKKKIIIIKASSTSRVFQTCLSLQQHSSNEQQEQYFLSQQALLSNTSASTSKTSPDHSLCSGPSVQAKNATIVSPFQLSCFTVQQNHTWPSVTVPNLHSLRVKENSLLNINYYKIIKIHIKRQAIWFVSCCLLDSALHHCSFSLVLPLLA